MRQAHLLRITLLAPVAAGGLAVAPMPLVGAPLITPLCAEASWPHHAALVVQHGDGRTIRLCIGFDAASISGEGMLSASGLEFATMSFGSLGDAVCQLDGEPATYPPTCFSNSGRYWRIYVSRGGAPWVAADRGISSLTLSNGDAEGFGFDPQSGAVSAPPSPNGTCALRAPPKISPTARPATALPSAAARLPSRTPSPTLGASPSASPSAVAGVESLGPRAVRHGQPPSGPSPGLLSAVAGGGALLGLLGAIRLRSRRRI